MDSKAQTKGKRRKKKAARTHVDSNTESDVEVEREESPTTISGFDPLLPDTKASVKRKKTSGGSNRQAASSQTSVQDDRALNDHDISAQFKAYYLQKVAHEFANDLGAIRASSDFKDSSVPILIEAIGQGAALFSMEDQRRIIMAGNSS